MRALRDRGHEVVIVGPAAVSEAKFGADAGIVAHLKKLLPLAVYEYMEAAYARYADRRLRRAYLAHRPDVLYERYTLFMSAGARLKARYGLPMLSEVNSPLIEERQRYGGLACVALARRMQRETWAAADYVLPVTEVLAAFVRREGVPDDKIVVVPNGIDLREFDGRDGAAAKRRLGIEGRLVLGFTGFLRDWHGLDRAVDFIVRRGAEWNLHLLIVGDGPARASTEAQAARLGVADRVSFTGIVGRDAVGDHVAAFDVALQPDVVPYASPLKLFEYMALGCAIVAPASPNIREVLTDGEDAVLFDDADSGAFARAIETLCADEALRRRLGAAARATIDRKGLTWDNNAARVEALFAKAGAGRTA